MTLSIRELSIKTLSIREFSIKTLSIRALSIKTLIIMTQSIMDLIKTLIVNDGHHNKRSHKHRVSLS